MILGMVGWRGMVGSVLMGRMLEENDFAHVEKTVFFSTSAAGGKAPDVKGAAEVLQDAKDAFSVRRDYFVSGRRLHQGNAPETARIRLGRLLD